MNRIDDIILFWFGDDVGTAREQWFAKSAAFDAEVRNRFLADYNAAILNQLDNWRRSARGSLAFVLLTDQFPRNMFRGERAAFASDPLALTAAMEAVGNQLDRELAPLQRAFLYLPFEHSESLADQDRAVELFETMRAEFGMASMIDYAHRHRKVIARFGRFPHRNKILGRASTPDEEMFLREPGSSF
ncbi:MAG: DUF924 family protein [Burkholderiales bacterium]|nr:DUF924 domain-containing protein [Burkholderiales bacterium]MDQ3195261.1 DUF924 domain-containing protein [Pseudomonadota bacterium]